MNREASLLHELPLLGAQRTPDTPALIADSGRLTYAELAAQIEGFANGLAELGIGRGERVAVFLDKRIETVVTSFGAAARGAVFVPINPLLKPEQVGYILRDCDVRVLVTTDERLRSLQTALSECPALAHVVVVDDGPGDSGQGPRPHRWNDVLQAPPALA
jgi:acyl-CoA synthetase (AMP-forming)/AMP-acid ligase II